MPRITSRIALSLALAMLLFAGGCGDDDSEAQADLNETVRSMLAAQGVPDEVATCLTEELEREFPLDKLEEMAAEGQENPFAVFGPEEQAAARRIARACGGAGARPGVTPSAPDPAGAAAGSEAYFDCVAAAGSSAEVAACEKKRG